MLSFLCVVVMVVRGGKRQKSCRFHLDWNNADPRNGYGRSFQGCVGSSDGTAESGGGCCWRLGAVCAAPGWRLELGRMWSTCESMLRGWVVSPASGKKERASWGKCVRAASAASQVQDRSTR